MQLHARTLTLLVGITGATFAQTLPLPATPPQGGAWSSGEPAASPGERSLYLSTLGGELYRIANHATSPEAILLGDTGLGKLMDVALDYSTGDLLLIEWTWASRLWRFDLDDWEASLVGTFAVDDLNALTTTPDGRCFARGFEDDTLWEVDPATAGLTAIGRTGTLSEGDLGVLDSGHLIGVNQDRKVDKIKLATGASKKFGYHGIAAVYGAAVDEDGTIYFINALREIHVFDPVTKQTTLHAEFDLDFVYFSGAAFGPAVGVLGDEFCAPANLNSSGTFAVLGAFGSSLAAVNEVRLTATGMPVQQFGMFLVGQTEGFTVPPGSQGNLCLAGPIGRYKDDVLSTGRGGEFSLDLDLGATPTPSGDVAIQPGETWLFQAWYRDANPMATSNLTQGLRVTFE